MKPLTMYQTAALMLCFTAAHIFTLRPEGANLVVCIGAETAAAGIVFVIAIIINSLPALHGWAGKAVSALAGTFFLAAFLFILIGYCEEVQFSFPEFYSLPMTAAVLAAATVYCASMGLSGCVRSACAAVVMTVIVLAVMSGGAASGFDPDRLNLAVSDREGQFTRQLISALARSWELPLLVLLMRRTGRPVRAAALYALGRAALTAGILTVCAGVLGSVGQERQPVMMLASFAKTVIVERFDALMLLFWTLCTLLAGAGLLWAAWHCLQGVMGKAERRKA
ncbi:MAG: GerAB/ArcD/ProY family transporter [Ruminococcus sp.]|nr:GerAB/ArcD/ProY family transporter [Ruminococcus sp.]